MTRARLRIVVVATALAFVGAAAAGAASGPLLPSRDPFYTYHASLAAIAPGTVLRQRSVSVAEHGTTIPVSAIQVLYRTTGELGQPTVTVATVIRPVVAPLVSKIVSYQTAYDALGSQCDPSYTLQGGNSSYSTAQSEEQIILGYVSQGETVVVPDYEGERLEWGAGQESGYGTLDGIRAAEHALGLPETTPAGMIGYSGGSIATEFAAELAPRYAPALNLVGTAAGGVPVYYLHNLAYVNGGRDWSGVIPAVVVALARAFDVSFTQFLSPYGAAVTNRVKDQCINDFAGNYPGLTIQKLLKPRFRDVLRLPTILEVANHLIMSRTGTPKGPLLIGVGNADGRGDGIMVSKDVEALAHTYCQRGVSVQFNEYSGADHTNAAISFERDAAAFLTQRLSGLAVPNGCSSIGAGNSLAPMPVPKSTPGLRVSVLGVWKGLHGFAVMLRSTAGPWPNLLVTLRRGGKVITQVRLPRLSGRHRIVLRDHGHAPPAGRYALAVSQGFVTLTERGLRIR